MYCRGYTGLSLVKKRKLNQIVKLTISQSTFLSSPASVRDKNTITEVDERNLVCRNG